MLLTTKTYPINKQLLQQKAFHHPEIGLKDLGLRLLRLTKNIIFELPPRLNIKFQLKLISYAAQRVCCQ